MNNQKSPAPVRPGVKKKHRNPPRLLTILMAAVIVASSAVDAFCIYDLFGGGLKAYGASVQEKPEEQMTEEEKEIVKQREEEEAYDLSLFDVGKFNFDPVMVADTENEYVSNSSQAMDLLRQVQFELGIEDVDKEYKYDETKETDDRIFYMFSQVYEGIEVFGSKLVVETDRNGGVIDVSGSHQKIPEGTETEARTDESLAKKNALDRARKDTGLNDDDMYADSLGKKLVKLDNGDIYLCYVYQIYSKTGNHIMNVSVNARTGQVEGTNSMLKIGMYTLDGSNDEHKMPDGQEGAQKLDVDKTYDNKYSLEDSNRNLNVYQIDRKADLKDPYNLSDQYSVYSWDPAAPKKPDAKDEKDKGTPDQSCIDAMANLQKIYDFYNIVFGRKGVNGSDNELNTFVGYNGTVNGKDLSNNAFMIGNSTIVVTIRKATDGKKLPPEYTVAGDVLAHEYTHGIIYSDCDFNEFSYKDTTVGYAAQDGINEGFADLFSEFFDDYQKNGKIDGDTDWIVGVKKDGYSDDYTLIRNMADPHFKKYTDYSAPAECHAASGIVTYPVYLMKSGGKADLESIAHIYYNVIRKLEAGCDYVDLRQFVEKEAAAFNNRRYNGETDPAKSIDDDGMEAVIDAFDKYGIPQNPVYKRLVPGGLVNVIDKNNQKYNNYNIKLYRYGDKEFKNPVLDEDVKTEDYHMSTSVHNGLYTAVLTDLADDKMTKQFTLCLNDNPSDYVLHGYLGDAKPLKIITNFGSEPRDVVLVLDVSGSMSGQPMRETIKSANNFVSSVLKASPSTRISVITYSYDSSVLIEGSNDKKKLQKVINGLRDNGNTNMYSGITAADDILTRSNSQKKLMVLMSDGYPNAGESDSSGYTGPIISYADTMKSRGIIIYSLGFFHSLSGSERTQCAQLMQSVASPGYYYEVGNSDDYKVTVDNAQTGIEETLNDISDNLGGKKYIYIRVACPVDVYVSFNGQYLDSSEGNLSTRTDFGTLLVTTEEAAKGLTQPGVFGDESSVSETSSLFGGGSSGRKDNASTTTPSLFGDVEEEGTKLADNTVKILRLAADNQYEICIKGTGTGTMDYSISYPDDEGNYTDVRKFDSVPISKDTVISTRTEQAQKVEMSVDSNGDGKTDVVYSAGENQTATSSAPFTPITLAVILLTAMIVILLIIEIILIILRIKYNKHCPNCGAAVDKNCAFCEECGQPVVRKSLLTGATEHRPQSKAGIIVKLAVIGVFVISTAVVCIIHQSAESSVFLNLRSGNTLLAQTTYNSSVKGNQTKEQFAVMLTNRYLDKAHDAYKAGNYTETDLRTLLSNAESIGNTEITNKCKGFIIELDKTQTEDKTQKENEKA